MNAVRIGEGKGAGCCSDFTLLIGASINSFFSAMMDADHQGSQSPPCACSAEKDMFEKGAYYKACF